MTRTTSATWSGTYAHDRRKHRHRCRACHKVLNAGEPALLARVADRKTWAIHEACAELAHDCGTWRDAMNAWGSAHLMKVGYLPKQIANYRDMYGRGLAT